MFSWFRHDTILQEALVRSYESTIGFLKTQLEYEQSKNFDLLKLLHTQAGLIDQKVNTHLSSEDFQAIETGSRSWSHTRKEMESAYASASNSKTKEIQDYIKDNESVIVGDYNPNDSERTN